MKKETISGKSLQENILFILFVFLASLYMVSTPGHFTTSMGVSAFLTAKSLIEDGDFALEKSTSETGVGKDGRHYVYMGLAFLLVVTAFLGFFKLLGIIELVSITNHILTAIACLLIFRICRELKYSLKISILIALVYGVGTMAWVHSRYLMPEPLTTVVYLAAFLFLLRYKNKRQSKWLFLCGFFTGLALIVRPEAPLYMLAIATGVFILFYSDYRKGNRDWWSMAKGGIVFIAPILFFFAVYAYYNCARFGNVFELGYATKRQQPEIIEWRSDQNRLGLIADTLQGFAGMWIIPCRSMFFINPVLIFIFWALKDFWRKFRFEFIIICIIFILHVILYSNRGTAGFPGSSAWGIRYMLPVTSLMVIVMGIFVEKTIVQRNRQFKIFVAVFILSTLFQFIGASQNYRVTQSSLKEQLGASDSEWDVRRMMNMNPRWNLITQNLKRLRHGHIDFMYYNFLFRKDLKKDSTLQESGPPAWLGWILLMYVCALLTSGYFLFKVLLLPATEPGKKERCRGKKKRRKKVGN